MGTHYKHLTWRERLRIETRLKDGWTPQKIADEIGRHVSTIYREIKRGLGVQRTVYYCHPYSSSERGSNEKQNGMTRRRHPKGTDFKKVSRKKLRETTEWINNYPRKMFGFHTAAELFAAAFPGLPVLC